MSFQFPTNNYLFGSFILTFLISFFGNELEYRLTTSHASILVDTIPPTVKCFTGIDTFPIPTTGCVNIQAKNLDQGSFDDITSPDKLLFYFDGDRNKEVYQFCCDDLVAAGECEQLLVELQLWVEDEAGNKNSCKVKALFWNNQDICPFSCAHYKISGEIRTENATYIETNATLSDSLKLFKQLSGNYYLFGELDNGLYELCFERNYDHRNGVSTTDIIKTKRHILEIEKFNSLYKLMAADVNRSKNITAADVSEIRRLVLGINKRFTYVPSWIFVPKELKFPANEFPDVNLFIPSCDSIRIKDSSVVDKNYIAIKMGDLNLNAKTDTINKILIRKQNTILSYQTTPFDINLLKTEFILNKDIIISGMQFTLSFNPTEFEFVKIENGSIQIDYDQFSLHELDKGKIHFSWDRYPLEKTSSTSGALFSIIWKKKTVVGSDLDLHFDTQGVQALLIRS